MAIRTFNSVGGFSVGETPANVILANGDITTGSAILTGNVDVLSGNVSVLRLRTDNLLHANGAAWDFDTAAGSTGSIQFKNAAGDLAANSNLTFSETGNLFSVTANANIAGVSITNTGGNANISASYFVGNFAGSISGTISSPGANTQLAFNDSGILSTNAALTFDKTSSNLQVGNLLTSTGNLAVGNLVKASYLEGTLTTLAQPNITSVGTLTSLAVSGNANVQNTVNTGNLNVTAKVISSLIPSNDNTYDIGSASNEWKNLYVGSNIYIGSTAYVKAIGNVIQTDAANVANSLTTGTFTSRGDAQFNANLTVAGNLTVTGTTTYVNATNLSITDPLIELGGSSLGGNASAPDAYDRGMVLHSYDGTNSKATNQYFGWKSGNLEFQAVADVLNYNGQVVTANGSAAGGGLANIRAQTFIGNFTGTISSSNQSQITTVGTLGNLSIAGNLSVGNVANIYSLKASGLQYPTVDGTNKQVLSTDGAGNLYFATIDTYRIANGTSNVLVNANGNIESTVNGTTSFKVTAAGANVSGDLAVSGNSSVTGSTTTGTLVIGNSSIRASTFTSSSISQQTIATVSTTGTRAVEFFVKSEESAGGKYSVATVSAVHNGSNVDYSVYGTVNLGGSTGSLAVTYLSGNLLLRATPASGNSTVWTTQIRTI